MVRQWAGSKKIMAYKSLTADLKLIRNQIQDTTENPYSHAAAYGSSTKYVFALGIKELTGTTPSDAELFSTDHRSTIPLMVTISLIGNPTDNDLDGHTQLFGILVRCFVAIDTTWTFKSASVGAEELALEKLNEIAYEFTNNSTIIAALVGNGLKLDAGSGLGTIRPIDAESRQDYGYAMELTFLRESVQ